jgi:hypothetical protein
MGNGSEGENKTGLLEKQANLCPKNSPKKKIQLNLALTLNPYSFASLKKLDIVVIYSAGGKWGAASPP